MDSGWHAMKTGAAVLLVATALAVAGCTSGSDTGATQPGPTSADVAPSGTAAPTTVITSTVLTPKTTTPPRKSSPVLRSEPSDEASQPPPGQGRGPSAPMRKSTPVGVAIPAIGVDSGLMRLGIKRNGNLQVPPNGFPAGWFTGGPTPGEKGPAVIAGHVRWSGRAGVFARLALVRPGDSIVITRQDRSVAVFRVTRVRQFPKSAFPTAAVYGDLDHAGLRVITCGGLDDASNKYEANLVVFADLIT
nr:class F sortase [Streptomyces sp. SID13031]